MGIFGHMTANSPIKGGGGDGKPSDDSDPAHSRTRNTHSFVEDLEKDLKKFDDKVDSSLEQSSLFKGQNSTTSTKPDETTPPHFTLDASPTRDPTKLH